METNSWQAPAALVDSTFERRSDSRLEIQNERTARHRLVQLALVAAVVYLPIGYMYWQGMSATSGSSILEIVQLIAQHVFSSLPLTAMAMYAALRLRDWRIHLLLSIGYFLMVLVGANAASLGMFRMAPNMAIVFFLISLETFANQTLAIGLFARIIGVRIIALGEPIARFRPFGISGMLIATALIAGMHAPAQGSRTIGGRASS